MHLLLFADLFSFKQLLFILTNDLISFFVIGILFLVLFILYVLLLGTLLSLFTIMKLCEYIFLA